MDCTICAFETSRRAGASSRVGGPVPLSREARLGPSVSAVSGGARCVYVSRKPLAGGDSPGPPQRHSARHKEAARQWSVPGSASGAGTGIAAARDHRVPSVRDAEQPGGQLVGEPVLRRPEAALDILSGPRLRGPSAGCSSSRRRGGDLRGSEGARPPASLRRGRTECGHGGYAGSPTLVASLSHLSGVRQAGSRQPRTPRIKPTTSAFRRAPALRGSRLELRSHLGSGAMLIWKGPMSS